MCKITVKGHIQVFPKDRSRLSRKKKPYEEQTIVIKLSNDIGRLYSSMLFKEKGILLEPPPFGCHVTLNNGKHYFDVAKQKDYLKELDGKAIQIVIDINMYRHWEFFAMPVIGTELNKIRRRLGLPYKDDFHVTIGRLHPNTKRLGLLTKEINEL